LPKARRFADDRAPTLDEILRIIEQPDRRVKPVIYTMSSAGISLEAWNYLRWGQIKPIEADGKVVAAKITIYAGDPGDYIFFIHNTSKQNPHCLQPCVTCFSARMGSVKS
jgi:hypothetical protein